MGIADAGTCEIDDGTAVGLADGELVLNALFKSISITGMITYDCIILSVTWSTRDYFIRTPIPGIK